MKKERSITTVLVACVVVMMALSAFGLGADHRSDQPVGGTGAWPAGLKALVNTTNRVHGFFVNQEDVFFFAGAATNFSAFLRDYAKIQGVEKHQLILHEGTGEAKSPWNTNGQPCDWKLYGCPAQWRNFHNQSKASRYVLEVHFWVGGKLALDQIVIPQNVEFAGEYLKVFESITNGMTRGEVEQKFVLDGGLQGASPVRFVHSSCPNFKVNVEFDFKRNAADQGRAISSKDDKVTRVCRPYLERPYLD